MKLQAKEAIGEASKEQLDNAYKILLDFNKPKNFNPNDKRNILLSMEKAYTKTIFAFAENNVHGAEKFSMFEFRTAIEMLKERTDRLKQETDKINAK